MRPPYPLAALGAAAASLALAACVAEVVVAPTSGGTGGADTTFTWSRTLRAGSQLAVRTGNGSVDVRETSAGRVEVVAVAMVVDRTRPASAVSLGVEESAGGVTVCALHDGARRCDDAMRPVNVRVDLTVLLPRGHRLVATTGNGEIAVAGAASVVATAGNGRIVVSDVPGAVVATTGNGEIELRQRAAGDADVTLVCGNGAITATLPASFQGRVEAVTGNGAVRSDFPVATVGPTDARRLAGTIGGGGPLLRMSTGNGTVTLRKG